MCRLRSAALTCTGFWGRSRRERRQQLNAGQYNERLGSRLPAAVTIPADRQTAAYSEALRAAMLPPSQLWRLNSDSHRLVPAQPEPEPEPERGRVWERQSRELGHCLGFHLIPPADPSHMAAWLPACWYAARLQISSRIWITHLHGRKTQVERGVSEACDTLHTCFQS